MILAIILGIAVIGGGAYILGQQKAQQAQLKQYENNLPTNEVVPLNQNVSGNTTTNNGTVSSQPVVNNTTTTTPCLPTTAPWIKVISPNGGETFTMGQQVTIKWKTCNAQAGETVNLGIGQEIPASQNNGISGAWNPSVNFLPYAMTNTGTATVRLNASSTQNGNWPFTPGTNYKVAAVLNPSSTNTGETPMVYDASDNSFTINSATTTGNLINLTSCGVSFSKTSNWSVVGNTSNEIKLDILPNDHTGFSGIDIKCVLDGTITDTDAKFGNITYFFESYAQKWMVNTPDEQNGGTLPAVIATPLFTVNGFPVFRGTRRWLSYVVPITDSSIVYLNEGDTEGGSTQSLTNLVNTLH